MSRAVPYRTRCPQVVKDLIVLMRSTRLFLVAEHGPTCYIIRSESSRRKHRVTLGSMQACSCGGGGSVGGELCIHLLYVMIKILRLPENNPLVWQLSLTDSEVDKIAEGRYAQINRQAAADSRRGSSSSATSSQGGAAAGSTALAKRKALGAGDVCPICQEDMTRDELLTFCRHCGNNIHTNCMKMWGEHQESTGKLLTCPLCRMSWGAQYDIIMSVFTLFSVG